MLSTLLLVFTLWQAPNGTWTKVGEGNSQAVSNPGEIISKLCVEGTEVLTPSLEGGRLTVICTPR